MNLVTTQNKKPAPLVPVEYEQAIFALQACVSLDESKYWSDKADALAAWAKIYRNDDAGRKAKQLKLHAYRRMGQLAKELRPQAGNQPGPISVLKENGLTQVQATAARFIANLDDEQFSSAVNLPRPPTPIATRLHFAGYSGEWWSFKLDPSGGYHFRSWVRKHPASEFVHALRHDETEGFCSIARELQQWVDELSEWLDEGLQHAERKLK